MCLKHIKTCLTNQFTNQKGEFEQERWRISIMQTATQQTNGKIGYISLYIIEIHRIFSSYIGMSLSKLRCTPCWETHRRNPRNLPDKWWQMGSSEKSAILRPYIQWFVAMVLVQFYRYTVYHNLDTPKCGHLINTTNHAPAAGRLVSFRQIFDAGLMKSPEVVNIIGMVWLWLNGGLAIYP